MNTFGYIAKAIGPQDVLVTLLNNLKVQERQNRVCTTVAIAIVAETCAPFTVLPALMNEYKARVPAPACSAAARRLACCSFWRHGPPVRQGDTGAMPARALLLACQLETCALPEIVQYEGWCRRGFQGIPRHQQVARMMHPGLGTQVPELNVQNGVLKSLSFLFEYIGEMGKDYIYAVTPLLEDALMDRDLVHRQTAASVVQHMALGVAGAPAPPPASASSCRRYLRPRFFFRPVPPALLRRRRMFLARC